MDINLPEPIESPELRVPGMYRITKPLPLTTRRIGLYSSKGKYTFSPSLANLKELNHVLRGSFNQTAYFCFPEPDVFYIFSASDEESEWVLKLIEDGDIEAKKAFTKDYIRIAGRFIAKDIILGDGTKIGGIEFVSNDLDVMYYSRESFVT